MSREKIVRSRYIVAPCGGVCDAVGDESELLATCDEDDIRDFFDGVGGLDSDGGLVFDGIGDGGGLGVGEGGLDGGCGVFRLFSCLALFLVQYIYIYPCSTQKVNKFTDMFAQCILYIYS